jgi:predicted GIY-YIG superfamily endonuclease
MAFWTYILRCADGRYYTGHTDDLERRIAEHQTGGYCDFTARRRPITLIWSQDFNSRDEALGAELIVKKWSRAKKEALAQSDWAALSFFAQPPAERVSTSLDTNGEAAETSSSLNREGLRT